MHEKCKTIFDKYKLRYNKKAQLRIFRFDAVNKMFLLKKLFHKN